MNCKACRVEIEEAGHGQTFSQPVAAHIEACTHCRAFHDEQSALRHMIGSLDVVAAPADFDFRLRARLAAAKDEGQQRFIWNRFAPGALSMAVAASFVLLLAVGLLVKQVWLSPGADNELQAIVKTAPLKTYSPLATPKSSPTINVTPTQSEVVADNPQRDFVAQRQRTTNVRVAEKTIAVVTDGSDKDGIRSVDLGSNSPAVPITPPGIPYPGTNSMVAVPVQASMKSATVMLDNGKATPQTISLRPVTFGAQEVVEQGDARKLLLKTPQGIW